MLAIRLRGEAQKLLGSLTMAQLSDYHLLKAILAQRFNPQEREIAHRCEFRHRRRNKGENVADYGYSLRRLGQKAYPCLLYQQLETYVIDQYINGLSNYELKKHVQFGHPRTLDQAIALATEFEALEGSVDRVKKPLHHTTDIISPINPTEPKPQSTISWQQISEMMDKKLEKLMQPNLKPADPDETSVKSRDKGRADPAQPPHRTPIRDTPAPASQRPMFCDYCKRNNHNLDKCWSWKLRRDGRDYSRETTAG